MHETLKITCKRTLQNFIRVF